ncbi:diguanylate cyclase [Phycisphaerales bacterium AB-hyl4]|uniref:diguanylate cyclase n=1 Tax=Natronomicrosphaera hydrolytica TaxID=3242702 RepID=A0ABV4U1I7_9BACT
MPVNPGPLLSVLRASPSDPDSVVSALGRCPALSARLLSVTNSAAFGVTREIDNVRRAVLHLGANRARSIALAFGLRALHEGIGLDEPWMSQLWIASLRKAAVAELACELIDPSRSENAFCLALIQDLGLPLLVGLDPGHYERVIAAERQGQWCAMERERFGIDHIELSMRLLRSWDAGTELRQAVYRHHEPPQLPDVERKRLSAVLDRRAAMRIPLYLASMMPHFDEDLSPEQQEWLVALHATFLAPTYATPDVFFQAAVDRAEPLHAQHGEAMPRRAQLTRELVEAVTTDTMGMVTQLSRLEVAVGRQREDLDNLRFQAFTDPLTKLLNRRGFMHLAERRLEVAGAQGLSACLMMLDMDNFKPVNDRFGHEAGDRMLRGVAKLLRRSLDRNDLIARIGGDEFVVLLCSLDEAQAREVVERVTSVCLDRRIKVVREPEGEAMVRFSLGAAYADRVSSTLGLEQLLQAADEAMYQRKREGKHGVVFRSLAPIQTTEMIGESCPLDMTAIEPA